MYVHMIYHTLPNPLFLCYRILLPVFTHDQGITSPGYVFLDLVSYVMIERSAD